MAISFIDYINKTPSQCATGAHDYDCTSLLGNLESGRSWAMYSYDRPAYIVWNAIAAQLYDHGWTDEQIKNWLQSKSPRHDLDSDLGDMLQDLGRIYGRIVARTETRDEYTS